jgi:hypothetical protein
MPDDTINVAMPNRNGVNGRSGTYLVSFQPTKLAGIASP